MQTGTRLLTTNIYKACIGLIMLPLRIIFHPSCEIWYPFHPCCVQCLSRWLWNSKMTCNQESASSRWITLEKWGRTEMSGWVRRRYQVFANEGQREISRSNNSWRLVLSNAICLCNWITLTLSNASLRYLYVSDSFRCVKSRTWQGCTAVASWKLQDEVCRKAEALGSSTAGGEILYGFLMIYRRFRQMHAKWGDMDWSC